MNQDHRYVIDPLSLRFGDNLTTQYDGVSLVILESHYN